MMTDLEWFLNKLNNILTGNLDNQSQLIAIKKLVTESADEISLELQA